MTMPMCEDAFLNEKDASHLDNLWKAVNARNHEAVLMFCMNQRTNRHNINYAIEGSTLLHQAVKLGSPLIVQHLLAADINADTLNNQGLTALELALEQGREDIIFKLIGKTLVTEQMLRKAIFYNNSDDVVATLFSSLYNSSALNQQGLFREQVSQNPLWNPGSTLRPMQ